MYLTQSQIASNAAMQSRVTACAAQQGVMDTGQAPDAWTSEWRFVWASSPGWDAAWESALAAHPDDPDFDPGTDEAVITDGMILSEVQSILGPPGTQLEATPND